MARERQRSAGELAAWHVAMIVARIPLSGEVLDPAQINPYRAERPKCEALRKLEEWQARRAWRAMFKAKQARPKGVGRAGQ